jgi:hypothetical protein
MPWTKILENVRFSSEKLVKVPLFDSDRMFFDVYCVGPGQAQKVHTMTRSTRSTSPSRGARP